MSWSKRILEWTEGSRAYLSVVFTWQLPEAWSRCVWYRQQGYEVIAGGPAIQLFPKYLAGVSMNHEAIECLTRHNPDATRFSTGCIRNCSFCAVPITEGGLKEKSGLPAPIVCDNNLLACSRKHFDWVIDTLKPVKGVDMNQGLDCRIIKPYHVDRLKELDLACVRFAWDNIDTEPAIMDAIHACLKAGIPKSKIRVYVLVGYKDTPEDALYRLTKLKMLGVRPYPMRFEPLDTLKKDSFVAPNWTDVELKLFVRFPLGSYWKRSYIFQHISMQKQGGLRE